MTKKPIRRSVSKKSTNLRNTQFFPGKWVILFSILMAGAGIYYLLNAIAVTNQNRDLESDLSSITCPTGTMRSVVSLQVEPSLVTAPTPEAALQDIAETNLIPTVSLANFTATKTASGTTEFSLSTNGMKQHVVKAVEVLPGKWAIEEVYRCA